MHLSRRRKERDALRERCRAECHQHWPRPPPTALCTSKLTLKKALHTNVICHYLVFVKCWLNVQFGCWQSLLQVIESQCQLFRFIRDPCVYLQHVESFSSHIFMQNELSFVFKTCLHLNWLRPSAFRTHRMYSMCHFWCGKTKIEVITMIW